MMIRMVCLILLACNLCPATETVTEVRPGFEHLLDSVVRIDCWETNFSGGAKRTSRGVGSGVIVSPEGHILTNAHVVNTYTERLQVTLNSLENVDARLLGWDHWTDLAVIQLDMNKIKAKGLSFSHAEFSDSGALKPGDTVFAVGTPNGLTRTVTRGIISNTQRYFKGRNVGDGYETGDFNTWLQTDAAINPGNSGGPLALPNGKVVGINTRGYLGANNLGFAVPGDTAQAVMDTLIREGKITRSSIGIVPAPLQDLENFFQLNANEGVLIDSVDAGSPAEKAGLKAGDIILEMNGKSMDGRFPEQLPSLLHQIALIPVGSPVDLKVKSGSEFRSVQVVTELLTSRVGEKEAFERWGVSVQKISRTVAREEKLKSDDGVRILGIQGGYPGDEAELQAGDVIVRINRIDLKSVDQLREVYKADEQTPSEVLLEVRRNHQFVYKVLKPRH